MEQPQDIYKEARLKPGSFIERLLKASAEELVWDGPGPTEYGELPLIPNSAELPPGYIHEGEDFISTAT